MPLLARCLRRLGRGFHTARPARQAAPGAASTTAAGRDARRAPIRAGPPPGPSQNVEETKDGSVSLVAAAAVLGGVLAWGFSSRRGSLPERYITREEADDLQRAPEAAPSIGSFQAVDENGKVVTEETLLDDGDFLLLLVEPGDRPDADEVPIREFAQINDAIAMESLMAWRLIRPVIMAPNVSPDADGIAVIKRAVETYRETLKSAFRRRSRHAIHGLIGGDTKRVAERAKQYAAFEKGSGFAAEAERRPTLYVVDPKGTFKHVWLLQARPIEVWQVSALVEEIVEYNL